ncbi:MAG: reductive dehalogenase [Dehalogenimonas sp.]
MKGFHSTVSRRDFMKGLGLAGAGVSAAAALGAPVFHDLDEAASSVYGKKSWWIKERDHEDITTEVDWKVYQAYDPATHPAVPVSQEVKDATTARLAEDKALGLAGKKAGFDRRAWAWYSASGVGGLDTDWNGNVYGTGTLNYWKPAATDVTQPWSKDPDYNLKVLQAAFHSFGTPTVGVVEITEHIQRLFNKGTVSWGENIAEPTYDAKKVYHIPAKAKYMVVWETQMSQRQSTYTYSEYPTPSGYGSAPPIGRMDSQAYNYARLVRAQAVSFMKGLGWLAVKPAPSFPVQSTAHGIFAGLGEQARPNYRMSPNFGLNMRYANITVTDMPLTPTKPIDFGGHRFCNGCKRCGEVCPTSSIDMSDEPRWDTVVPKNNAGIKAFFMNWDTCPGFGSPAHCGICQPTCPFNHAPEAIIHPIIRATASTTGIFNSFFGQMDRAFGYSKVRSDDEMEAWWTRELSTDKGDTILGAGKFTW